MKPSRSAAELILNGSNRPTSGVCTVIGHAWARDRVQRIVMPLCQSPTVKGALVQRPKVTARRVWNIKSWSSFQAASFLTVAMWVGKATWIRIYRCSLHVLVVAVVSGGKSCELSMLEEQLKRSMNG
eukprot:594503-Amphidinium_carterae.1